MSAPNQTTLLDVSHMWMCFYRYGAMANIQNFVFRFEGNAVDARALATKYCGYQNFKLINITPFLTDIAAAIKEVESPRRVAPLVNAAESGAQLAAANRK